MNRIIARLNKKANNLIDVKGLIGNKTKAPIFWQYANDDYDFNVFKSVDQNFDPSKEYHNIIIPEGTTITNIENDNSSSFTITLKYKNKDIVLSLSANKIVETKKVVIYDPSGNIVAEDISTIEN